MMKQKQMVFAVLVSVLLLLGGGLLTLVSVAGWKLVVSGCLLGILCFVQGLLTGNTGKFASVAQDSHGH